MLALRLRAACNAAVLVRGNIDCYADVASSANQLVQLRSFGNSTTCPQTTAPSSSAAYVYNGPFAAAVKRVKSLSLFSCACALASGPIIFALDSSASSIMAKTSIVATLSSFGLFTTGLMHWFTSPYVLRLVHHPETDAVEVSCLNFLARPRTWRFSVADVSQPDTIHPLSTFAANGKVYYVDKDSFANKRLLERLAPADTAGESRQETESLDDS